MATLLPQPAGTFAQWLLEMLPQQMAAAGIPPPEPQTPRLSVGSIVPQNNLGQPVRTAKSITDRVPQGDSPSIGAALLPETFHVSGPSHRQSLPVLPPVTATPAPAPGPEPVVPEPEISSYMGGPKNGGPIPQEALLPTAEDMKQRAAGVNPFALLATLAPPALDAPNPPSPPAPRPVQSNLSQVALTSPVQPPRDTGIMRLLALLGGR